MSMVELNFAAYGAPYDASMPSNFAGGVLAYTSDQYLEHEMLLSIF